MWAVLLPSCSFQLIHTQTWDIPVCQPLPCRISSPLQVPISAPPASLDECFFNSLVVRLPYSLVFWQSGCFLLLDWLSFFWLCKEAKHIYQCLHLGQKLQFLRVHLFHPLPPLGSMHTMPPSDVASVVCVRDKYH